MPRLIRQAKPTNLSVPLILNWADAFHERFGRWPNRDDGNKGLPDSTWSAVDQCLKGGHRGLKRGASLAKLLHKQRGRRHLHFLTPLTIDLILKWADRHHDRTGEWPGQDAGRIPDAPGETWPAVNAMLTNGGRTLPGGSSLAMLLEERRGVRNPSTLPKFSVRQILNWIKAFHQRTGDWPQRDSGVIAEAPEERWSAVNHALFKGCRGLPGGSSLPRLLAEHFGVRNPADLPRLRLKTILKWSDAHCRQTGDWPTADSGAIADSNGETWLAVDMALTNGIRGLPGGDSLARFLARYRGKRNQAALPALHVPQILKWADAYRARAGEWPRKDSGPIAEAPGESWASVHGALQKGLRGLAGGTTLAQLLEYARGVRNVRHVPRLSLKQILAWVDAFHERTGKWPKSGSGPILEAPGETWSGINSALQVGRRGLKGGQSLAILLAERRGVRNQLDLPPLSTKQILAWADAHKVHTGSWPRVKSGAVPDAPGEKWAAIDMALRSGARGLPGKDSLTQLLVRFRGIRNSQNLPDLTLEQITLWVVSFRKRTGSWPRRDSGAIPESSGETWSGVAQAMYAGRRGLSDGMTLPELLQRFRTGAR